ncbi:hypothetical protein OG440_39550 (plasmid) [Streptomyces sp. NBC_00637]|uniref:hypothetical protein n=1 Tax=Streptomyces sp. NBC_00637 TaxID=2903667 RepID=UPI002F91A662
MIKRKTVGLAAAAALLGGLGAFGATTAFASSPSTDPKPTPTATTSTPATGDSADTNAMIRHCTKHLPAGERDKAEKQMRDMMADRDHESGDSMMGGTSGSSMMGGSTTDMMSGGHTSGDGS